MALDRDVSFTWFGHAAVLAESSGGTVVLIDPWLGNPVSPTTPDAIARVDVMLVTHGHSDHFGDALSIGSRTRPIWPTIHEMQLWLARNYAHADRVIGMNKGGTVEAAGVRVTMTGADHSAGEAGGSVTKRATMTSAFGAVTSPAAFSAIRPAVTRSCSNIDQTASSAYPRAC